jgi:hypothetical protein
VADQPRSYKRGFLAGAVAPDGDRFGRGLDLAVRDAQEDDLRARLRASSERALDRDAGVAQGRRQRVAEPAGADDGAAFKGGRLGGVPVQFSHEIPAGLGSDCGLPRSVPWW